MQQTVTVKDLTEYGNKKPVSKYLKPETFGLSNDDCQHKKVINMLNEQGYKPLCVLKNDPAQAQLVQSIQVKKVL